MLTTILMHLHAQLVLQTRTHLLDERMQTIHYWKHAHAHKHSRASGHFPSHSHNQQRCITSSSRHCLLCTNTHKHTIRKCRTQINVISYLFVHTHTHIHIHGSHQANYISITSIQVQVWIQRPITRTSIKRIPGHRTAAATIQHTVAVTLAYHRPSIQIKYLEIQIGHPNSHGAIYQFSQIQHRMHRIHSKHCIHKRRSIIQHKIMADQATSLAIWIRINYRRSNRLHLVCHHHKDRSCIDQRHVNPVCSINFCTTNRAAEEILHQCMTSCDHMSFS